MQALEGYFKGLADHNRMRIINLLLHGELCVCDIQRILDASQPNVSRHLNYLKHSGLVLDRREGFRVFYRLSAEGDSALQGLWEFLCGIFKRERILQADLRKLRQAIREGACAVPPRQEIHRTAVSQEPRTPTQRRLGARSTGPIRARS
jgi:ArsR family transcriptional regulator